MLYRSHDETFLQSKKTAFHFLFIRETLAVNLFEKTSTFHLFTQEENISDDNIRKRGFNKRANMASRLAISSRKVDLTENLESFELG